MNDIIQQAVNWNIDLLEFAKDQKVTYEDVCGTGDLTDEERKQLYDAMDGDIKMFETVISALKRSSEPTASEFLSKAKDIYSNCEMKCGISFKCPIKSICDDGRRYNLRNVNESELIQAVMDYKEDKDAERN